MEPIPHELYKGVRDGAEIYQNRFRDEGFQLRGSDWRRWCWSPGSREDKEMRRRWTRFGERNIGDLFSLVDGSTIRRRNVKFWTKGTRRLSEWRAVKQRLIYPPSNFYSNLS